jgi:hypothetical protein
MGEGHWKGRAVSGCWEKGQCTGKPAVAWLVSDPNLCVAFVDLADRVLCVGGVAVPRPPPVRRCRGDHPLGRRRLPRAQHAGTAHTYLWMDR